MPIELVIGAGDWGLKTPQDEEAFTTAIRKYKSIIKTIDTAALHPLSMPGASEKAVGEGAYANDGFLINTKALFTFEGGCYTTEGVEKSVTQSLQSLKIPKINVLYTHAPDKKTPVSEQAIAFDKEYQKGHFTSLGAANLDAKMLQEWINISKEDGYISPTVYQGQYNLLCRAHEAETFPAVRQNGMIFVAYSPLAGGFLSGLPTFSSPSELVGTRFEHVETTANYGPFYRVWYDKESMHSAIRELKGKSDGHGIGLPEVAIRWLVHHSALQDGDAIIIGPQNVEELEKYVEAYKAGPLPAELVDGIEEVQEMVKEDAESIVRF
ncbi:aldehyde reductase [Clohesyomyces aquaticus]|uniref:Aldehyde reductase n=1 Tax=Clohesyomyces aquaticus TaxID=1231657 RepID=A0A1Y1ZU16_9PLEO|nr:aldehyde reductase [Clohesyomyces aquaticus]